MRSLACFVSVKNVASTLTMHVAVALLYLLVCAAHACVSAAACANKCGAKNGSGECAAARDGDPNKRTRPAMQKGTIDAMKQAHEQRGQC